MYYFLGSCAAGTSSTGCRAVLAHRSPSPAQPAFHPQDCSTRTTVVRWSQRCAPRRPHSRQHGPRCRSRGLPRTSAKGRYKILRLCHLQKNATINGLRHIIFHSEHRGQSLFSRCDPSPCGDGSPSRRAARAPQPHARDRLPPPLFLGVPRLPLKSACSWLRRPPSQAWGRSSLMLPTASQSGQATATRLCRQQVLAEMEGTEMVRVTRCPFSTVRKPSSLRFALLCSAPADNSLPLPPMFQTSGTHCPPPLGGGQ